LPQRDKLAELAELASSLRSLNTNILVNVNQVNHVAVQAAVGEGPEITIGINRGNGKTEPERSNAAANAEPPTVWATVPSEQLSAELRMRVTMSVGVITKVTVTKTTDSNSDGSMGTSHLLTRLSEQEVELDALRNHVAALDLELRAKEVAYVQVERELAALTPWALQTLTLYRSVGTSGECFHLDGRCGGLRGETGKPLRLCRTCKQRHRL
jgi:hypothetical protein